MRTAVSLQHPVSLFPETDPSSRPFQRLADALEEKIPQTVDGRSFSRFWFRRFLEPAGFPAAIPEQPAVTADAPPPSDRRQPSENEKGEPVAPPDRLAALRAECWQVLEEMEDARLLAQWLEGLHARYWDRFGRPAIDLQRLLDRLESDPDAHEEVLGQLRNHFRAEPPDAPAPEAGWGAERAEEPSSGAESVAEAPAGIAIGEGAPASAGAEQRPDFGLAAHETRVPQIPVPATRGGGLGRAHAYDPRRFGAQRELAERLRRMGPDDGTMLDLIGRL
jgi:flagellar biosynthesis protein FlhG